MINLDQIENLRFKTGLLTLSIIMALLPTGLMIVLFFNKADFYRLDLIRLMFMGVGLSLPVFLVNVLLFYIIIRIRGTPRKVTPVVIGSVTATMSVYLGIVVKLCCHIGVIDMILILTCSSIILPVLTSLKFKGLFDKDPIKKCVNCPVNWVSSGSCTSVKR